MTNRCGPERCVTTVVAVTVVWSVIGRISRMPVSECKVVREESLDISKVGHRAGPVRTKGGGKSRNPYQITKRKTSQVNFKKIGRGFHE